ncbi:MAG TPA: ATP-binding protein, partial [Thermoanaerobaculia bacterium]|nr:ATP-binding protein [Thermoanaerobaculia bacterium]
MSNGTSWQEANQRYLTAELALVSHALERHAKRALAEGDRRSDPPGPPDPMLVAVLDEAAAAMPAPPALEAVVQRFGMSPFERDVLLLAAGPELDSAFAARCAAAQGDPALRLPTFNLALAALPGAHWSALLPSAPLRYWRLVELDSRESLTLAPLRIDERVLHHLAGLRHMDERLSSLIRPLPEQGEPIPSHRELAHRIAKAWAEAAGCETLPGVQLCGGDSEACRAIAAAACGLVGLDAYVLSAAVVPTAPVELEGLIRLWEREVALTRGALLIDAEDLDGN